MAVNTSYPATAPGVFKILHIVFGAITLGCGGHSYDAEYAFDRVFLWSAVTCFVISFFYLLVHIGIDGLRWSAINKLIDMTYHIIGGILLIVGGSLMITSVRNYNGEHCNLNPWGSPPECQPRQKEKLAGASFAIINGIFYMATSVIVGIQKNEEMEYDTRIRGYAGKNDTRPWTTVEKSPASESI